METFNLMSWQHVLVALILFWASSRISVFYKASRDYPTTPWIIQLIPSNMHIVPILYLLFTGSPSAAGIWDRRGELYKSKGSNAVIYLPLLLGDPLLYVSSPQFFRQTVGDLNVIKPPMGIQHLNILGRNIVTVEGKDWKRHRKVTNQAFNQETYRNVWDVSTRVYEEIINTARLVDRTSKGSTIIDNMNEYTKKLAAFVVSEVSFGIPLSLDDRGIDKDGNWTIQKVVIQAAAWILQRGFLPKPILNLPFQLFKDIIRTYDDFLKLTTKLIADRTNELKAADESDTRQVDIVGSLLAARRTDSQLTLSDEEIIGNCYIMFFAGHETTAKALTATIALLAQEPEIQETLYQTIKSVVGDGDPTFEDYDALFDVAACFYEGVRLYPPAYMMVRQTMQDMVYTIPSPLDETIQQSVPVYKETPFVLDIIGLCHNPAHFPNPLKFDPTRWTPTTDHPAFSTGVRACQGKKFATVEAVAFLARFFRDWKVSVATEGMGVKGIEPKWGFTIGIEDLGLVFIRRQR